MIEVIKTTLAVRDAITVDIFKVLKIEPYDLPVETREKLSDYELILA